MSASVQKKLKAKEFDRVFETSGVSEFLDLKTAKARYPVQRISIDMSKEMLRAMDREAARMGVPRTSLIKVWLAERLDPLLAPPVPTAQLKHS